MSRRVLLRAGLLLGVVLVGALLSPDGRWWLWGHLRGEAFSRGRPTSSWRPLVKESGQVTKALKGRGLSVIHTTVPPTPPPSPVEVLVARALRPFRQPFVLPDEEDPAAVPVLRQLAADPDPDVHDDAAYSLRRLGESADAGVP